MGALLPIFHICSWLGRTSSPLVSSHPALWAVLLVTLSWKHLCLPLCSCLSASSLLPSQVFSCSLPLCPGKHASSVHSLLGSFWIQRLCWQLKPGSFPSLAPGSLRSSNVWLSVTPQTTGSPSLLLSFAPFIPFASEILVPASSVCISDVRRFF